MSTHLEDESAETHNIPDQTGTSKGATGGKTREEIQADIRALAEKARIHAQQSLFNESDFANAEDDEDELGGYSLRNIADRDESHRLYFGLYGVMKRNLPQGKANEKLRRYVYDEVLLYLNQGKRKDARGVRGSSGQMAYIPTILEPAFAIVMNWVKTGANPFDLYSAFEAQNISLGYYGGKGGATPPASTPVPNPAAPTAATAPTAESVSHEE